MAKDSLTLAQRLQVLVPVVPTPMLEDESLDEAGFERLAAFTLTYPFSGIWALASAGEDQNLSDSVIDRATDLFVAGFGGKVPVHDLVACGDLPTSRAQQRVINEFIARMPKLSNREVHGEVKCVLEIRGVISRHVSAPFVAATDDLRDEFVQLIDELNLFERM